MSLTVNREAPAVYTVLGYVAILAATVVVALVLGTLSYLLVIRGGVQFRGESSTKWFGFAWFSAFTFGYVIKRCRRHRHKKIFWCVIAALLAAHIGIFLVLFRLVEHWRYAWFVLILIVEGPFIDALANWGVRRLEIQSDQKHSN